MLEFFRTLVESDRFTVISSILFAYILVFIVIYKTGGLKFMSRLMGNVFYSEPNSTPTRRLISRLFEMERQVHNIEKILNNKNLEGQRIAIAAELEQQLTKNLPKLVAEKLEKFKSLETSVDQQIKETIENAVSSFLAKHEPSKLIEDRREQLRLNERIERSNILEKTIQEQSQSAGRLKAVMINLFVLFNIGVLLIYLFAASSLTDRAVTAIIGLYVSLAAFIVYIYRSSNFRSSVLLALREDAKKYFDADEYIRRLKPGSSPSERDIEVLKLLLLNRAEREKMAHHPYELILKGVSNSNIQLKGGKMISATKTEKPSKPS